MEKSDRFPGAMLPILAATKADNTATHTDSMIAILFPLFSSIFAINVKFLTNFARRVSVGRWFHPLLTLSLEEFVVFSIKSSDATDDLIDPFVAASREQQFTY